MARRVLIVGLGIGGMAAAISLRRAGWTPIIVERAPERRTGGYFIGLFDLGKEAATELGVLDDIHTRSPASSDTWDIRDDGSRHRSPGFLDQAGSPAGVLRGDIEEGFWRSIEGQVDVRFGTVPVSIENEDGGVRVRLREGREGPEHEERFDLVIGCDGVRSSVREMVFGPHERFLHSLNAIVCAYQLEGQMSSFRSEDGIMLCEVDRALWVFPLADHTPTALFTYRTRNVDAEFEGSPIERLRAVYRGMDDTGIIDEALEQLGDSDDFPFDSVHQVRMPSWRRGRVVLLGDAAWCLTLYSGMGATSAMKGGAELGRALEGCGDGDVEDALDAWEKGLRPLIRKHQFTAYLKAEVFVPSTRLRAGIRRTLMKLGARKLVDKRRRAAAGQHTLAKSASAVVRTSGKETSSKTGPRS